MLSAESNEYIQIDTVKKATCSTLQLLLIFLNKTTQTGKPAVTISISEAMALRGVSDESFLRKQLERDLAYLDSIRFSYKDKSGAWRSARISAVGSFIKTSVIYFVFDDSFLGLMPKHQYMELPEDILKTQKNENIAARFMLVWRICQHKRMNLDRPNADLIPVRSLLSCNPAIPHYENLKAGQVSKRIITPFANALDRSGSFLTWEYELDEPESYFEFLNSRIRIHWVSEPYAANSSLKRTKARRRVAGRKSGSER